MIFKTNKKKTKAGYAQKAGATIRKQRQVKRRFQFWRRNPEPQRKSVEFGNEFRKQRKQDKWQIRRGKVTAIGRNYARFGLVGLLVVGIVLVLVGVVIILHQQQVFVVEKINVTGNKNISDLAIVAELQGLVGQGMYSFSAANVEQQLKDTFPYIKSATVTKVLPSEVNIEVIERFPKMAYINLGGVYLVDDERVVVDVLSQETTEPFANTDIGLLSGEGDTNAEYVAEYHLANRGEGGKDWQQLSQPERQLVLEQMRNSLQNGYEDKLRIIEGYGDPNAEYVKQEHAKQVKEQQSQAAEAEQASPEFADWEQVDINTRKQMLGQLAQKYSQLANERLAAHNQIAVGSGIANLTMIEGLDVDRYLVGDLFHQVKFDTSFDVAIHLWEEGIWVVNYRWVSDFTLQITLGTDTVILFTTTLPLAQQYTALEAIRYNGKLDLASEIDLRGELVSIKWK